MKNALVYLTLLILVFWPDGINAQAKQGNTLVGLSTTLNVASNGSDIMGLGFTTVKYKSDAEGFSEADADKMRQFNLAPKVGYFVMDNFAVGVDLYIAYNWEKEGSAEDVYARTLFTVGPYLRYYFATSIARPFVETSATFGGVKNKYDYSDDSYWEDEEYKSSLWTLSGGLGLGNPLGHRAFFETFVGYQSLTIKDRDDNPDNNRTIVNTVGIKLGVSVVLGRSKEQ